MKKVLIFAGTTEGRKLSEYLSSTGIAHTVCIATEYGEIVLTPHPLRQIHRERMDRDRIRSFILRGNYDAVVDATHPYAEVITENIRRAMSGMEIPCLRLIREQCVETTHERAVYFGTCEECAKALEKTTGNILLTTGSKDLPKYCASETLRERLYVRVLPSQESLSLCEEQGITGRQVIAMQGPFTAEMNEAVIRQYGISCLVTKESGVSGGFREKMEAAKRAGIQTFVIGCPKEQGGFSFSEICAELERICGRKFCSDSVFVRNVFEIVLAGVGMGCRGSLTEDVREAAENADFLFGAKRLLEPYMPKHEKKPFYRSEQIIPYLEKIRKRNENINNMKVVILFSGDSGFYSGCRSLSIALQEAVKEGRIQASIRILPGISSISYLASCIGESYHDSVVYSMHGREVNNLARRIREEPKVFLLMSGVKELNDLGELLTEAGLQECEIVTGYQLSYAEQEIRSLTAEECCRQKKEGLYTCMVRNRNAVPKSLTHGISDREFIRDRVPMTKEEVREVSVCKLRLHKDAVVYDIGSGTGSVAVEAAGLSYGIQVYAIERKKEAADLILRNKEKFLLDNIIVQEGEAPEILHGLQAASHAFIGGSGGRLKEILSALYGINPHMRIVINAVSMETVCEMKEILLMYPTEHAEIVQIQVSRAKEAGDYHLMCGENPVWICSFDFAER